MISSKLIQPFFYRERLPLFFTEKKPIRQPIFVVDPEGRCFHVYQKSMKTPPFLTNNEIKESSLFHDEKTQPESPISVTEIHEKGTQTCQKNSDTHASTDQLDKHHASSIEMAKRIISSFNRGIIKDSKKDEPLLFFEDLLKIYETQPPSTSKETIQIAKKAVLEAAQFDKEEIKKGVKKGILVENILLMEEILPLIEYKSIPEID